MQTRKGHWTALSLGVAFASVLTLQSAWAEPENPHGKGDYDKGEYSHGKGDAEHGKGYGKDGHGYRGGHGMMGGLHASTGHLLRHMLKHSTEIGLKDDQVAKLKDMQLNLDKTRIKAEADIMISERELRAMVEDDKSDLSAIESKLKDGEAQEVGLRMAAIKMRREALALLTPDQRGKLKSEHEKMLPPHRVEGGNPHGDSTGGMKKDDGKRGH
jgi:periplasmic protein CpxP/Spy